MTMKLADRILILDGAQGTMIQRRGLTEADFRGSRFASWPVDLMGNNDLLSLTRPDVIEDIARQYVEAGADIISTNTFNANAISLADYDMAPLAREIAREGARIARRVADGETGRKVLVAGSIGPTNKTASMSPSIDDPGYRAVTYKDLYDAYSDQIAGLIEGGVDVLLFETVFDTLNLKAGLDAAVEVMGKMGKELPVMVSVTIAGKDGRTFSGQTLEAFVASISHAPVWSIGLNCSFGPREIMPWIRHLAAISPWPVSCHPNAGLPDASGCYSETPGSMAGVMDEIAAEGLVNIIGGCCGTTPEHIAKYKDIVNTRIARPLPAATATSVDRPMRLSGLERLEVSREGGFVNVGERCNVAGSRKFLRLISEGAYDEALAIARKQIEDGAQVIDINMDDGLLDTGREMTRFLNLLAAEPDIAGVPVMVDSSKWPVIESALECIQGKSIVNSISLKEGETTFIDRARRLRRLGAAVVVMAFDEQGQADTYERKIEVCGRAYRLITQEIGFPPEDIIFDPNVLTIATGIPEHDRYALDFIRATEWIKSNLPGAKVSGGLSNLSFAFRGNNPLREAMHSVFLHHAVKAGMDMAILNPATKVAYESIEPELRELLEDVILCRRDGAAEELAAYAAAHPVVKKQPSSAPAAAEGGRGALTVGERLAEALVKGDASHLEADLAEALASGMEPVEIIDGPLMKGMDRVGTLFGEGRMFLPQVVKTARTMKAAVAILQPEIDRRGSAQAGGAKAGKILFATVKGDVHDIGKNIVSIVLACNNYEVIDLGVMVPASEIVETALREKPDIICLSGLITPSLDEMVHVAEELRRAGLDIPLMVGGATTSRLHTALKIDPVYGGPVIHVPDAARNPLLAARLLNPQTRDAYIAELKAEAVELRAERARRDEATRLEPIALARAKAVHAVGSAAAPSVEGREVVHIPVGELIPLINWRAFLTSWDLPATFSGAFTLHDCEACRGSWLADNGNTPQAAQALGLAKDAWKMLRKIEAEGSLDLVTATFSINRCTVTPDDTIIIGDVAIPTLRRQTPDNDGGFTSLSDYLCPESDWIGSFAIAVHTDAEIETLKERGEEYDSLLLQSLSHRLAEAGSEWLQKYVADHRWDGLAQGIRPAVGYPSLPDQTLTRELDKLLKMNEIGITLTENGAMHPSASVSGLYIANPSSRYILLGPLGDDQLADYATRRSLTLPQVKALLNR